MTESTVYARMNDLIFSLVEIDSKLAKIMFLQLISTFKTHKILMRPEKYLQQ